MVQKKHRVGVGWFLGVRLVDRKKKKKIMREESRRGERSNVEMIRIVPRKGEDEELFDVEKELGRDVTSVFGKSSFEEEEGEGNMSSKFVTASELERLRKERAGKGGDEMNDDKNEQPAKPLWQILQEQKDLKEEKFQEGWKTMKEGKNRPLEEDEIEFLDEVEAQKRANEKRKREEEKELSKQFKLARAKSNSKSAAEDVVKKKRESARDEAAGVVDDGDFTTAAKVNKTNAKKKLVKVAKKTTTPPPTGTEKDETEPIKDDNNNINKTTLGGLLAGSYSSSSE